MPKIDILLAAYNGERYIAEQLDSLLSQTFQDFRILIRDDGSSDNTPAIIEEYSRKYPGQVEIVHDDVVCKDPVKNFFELLKHARADYVMFCDQDDVWLPKRVQATYDRMKEVERDNHGKAVLVFCGKRHVDSNLNSIEGTAGLEIPEETRRF